MAGARAGLPTSIECCGALGNRLCAMFESLLYLVVLIAVAMLIRVICLAFDD